MNSYHPVTALLRGLKVLERISADGHLAVGDLHAATGLPKPTLVRLLETLVHAGYVFKDERAGRYGLAAKVLLLSQGYNANERLVELAAPILRELRAGSPWPSDFAVFDRDAMVIIETNRDPGTFALNRSVGTRMPMLLSALGRAYLAFCPEEARRRILALLAISANPLDVGARDPAAIERQLARYRELGFGVNDGDLSPTTRVIAVPVMVSGEVIACINAITLAEVMSLDQVIARCLPPLQQAAQRIAQAVARERDGTERARGPQDSQPVAREIAQ